MTKPHSSKKKSTHTHSAHRHKAHVQVHVKHHIDKRGLWQAQDITYQNVQRIVAGSPAIDVFGTALAQALRKDVQLEVGCMDERCVPPSGWKKIAIAGSCVLLSEEQVDLFVDHLKQCGLLSSIKVVTYHQHCGACSIYCKGHSLASTDTEMEKVGKSVAASLMEKLGLTGEPVYSGYSAKAQEPWKMTGNPHLHHARAIVVNGIAHFNPYALPLPACFEIDACFIPDASYLKAEIDVALSIAMGDHGFGKEMFDPANGGQPLSIIIVPHPTDPALSFDILDVTVKTAASSYGACVQTLKMEMPQAML